MMYTVKRAIRIKFNWSELNLTASLQPAVFLKLPAQMWGERGRRKVIGAGKVILHLFHTCRDEAERKAERREAV